MAKLRKLPFSISVTIFFFLCAFDLIHCDLWGPFSVPDHNGIRFFLTITDDFTRCTWVYLLQTKSQIQNYIKSFFHLVETQFNLMVKVIRTNFGTEFHLPDFFNSKGAIHQHSCVATPQQNGRVECKHQHLFGVDRSLRFQSNLPLSFWSHCVLSAAYLINRLPSPLLGNKSPFELLFSIKPDYHHLRTFGCLCYVSTLTKHRHKFDARANPCVFVGYPYGIKGYKVYNLYIRKFSVS